MKHISKIIPVAVVVIFLISQSAFVVNEGRTAIKLRLGQITANNLKPGLHFKIPFVESKKVFDIRLQALDAQPEFVLTREKKELIVDFFVEWKIKDTQKFYVSTGGGNISRAESIISQIASADLRGEFAKRTVNEVVSKDRNEIMNVITRSLASEVSEQGFDVIDVRVKRVEFSDNIKSNVFARMQSERNRVSESLRAQGQEVSKTIRAETDREVQIILANANRDAEILRGQGEAIAIDTYAKAFGKDKDFYKFQKSLDVYEKSFNGKNNTLVTTPDSEFFKYFKQNK